ncbi:MAG TPA: NAD(P)H-hydrate dehydratase [Geobacterales bacterium]|nr:NAD(P)H-hydrate dehydratase [Geobacterales bacterium]
MISLKEMIALEENAEEIGLSRKLLMENAGSAIASYLKTKGLINDVMLVAGTGNKAGDGFVALRHILAFGGTCKVLLAEREENLRTQEAKENFNVLKQIPSLKIFIAQDLSDEDIRSLFRKANVIIDGLIGTGLRGKLSYRILRLIRLINEANCFKLSIDIPTGIDPDTGENAGDYVRANVVITMHRMKKGLIKYKEQLEIHEANIGIPLELEYIAGRGDAKILFDSKPKYAKKGDAGRLLIIGGSKVYHGAPILAGLAALRSGVDLVYMYLPYKIADIARSISPEFIVFPYNDEELTLKAAEEATQIIEKVDTILIGNGIGLGHDEAVEKIFEIAEQNNKIIVADADALKTRAVKKNWKMKIVYTPHVGEFKIMTGVELKSYDEIKERMKQVEEASNKLNAIFLVKGHYDIISDGKKTKICKGGTQAMTVGGTGDVLAGLCSGLIARTKKVFESSIAASYINKKAGERATEKYGNQIKASDLVEFIPKIIKELDPTYQN